MSEMTIIYKKVLEHSDTTKEIDEKKAVIDLINYLNNETELSFPKNSVAIYTVIRHSYIHFKINKMNIEANKIVKTYKPYGYVLKVLRKYKI